MIGYTHNNVIIGVDTFPTRKKPCLVIVEGNCETKYASFNNDRSAKIFIEKLGKFINNRNTAHMTNFEKIKTMNEKELARLLVEVQFDYMAADDIAWLNWLNSEVKE